MAEPFVVLNITIGTGGGGGSERDAGVGRLKHTSCYHCVRLRCALIVSSVNYILIKSLFWVFHPNDPSELFSSTTPLTR